MKGKIITTIVMTLLIAITTLPVVANINFKKMSSMKNMDNVYDENLNLDQVDKMLTTNGAYSYDWISNNGISVETTSKTCSQSLTSNYNVVTHFLMDRDYRNLMRGWPQYYENIGPVTVADIDDDNKLEIITFVRHQDSGNVGIGVWEHDGSIKTGFPVHLPNIGSGGGIPPVAIGDVNNDGKLEIVTGYGWNSGKIYVIKQDGSILTGWPQNNGGEPSPVSGFATLIDLDRDGYLEILTGGKRLNVWKYDGTNVVGFPKGIYCTSPAVGDLNKDSVLEIVTITMTNLYVYNPSGVELLNIVLPAFTWPYPPVLGDINNDGKLEILFSLQNGKVCAYTMGGVLVKTWTFSSSETATSPVIGDVNRDGYLEIFLCTHLFGSYGKIYGWDRNGINLPGWPITLTSVLRMLTTPILGDVDGDTYSEIIVGGEEDPEYLYAFNSDGTVATGGWPKTMTPVYGYGIMGSAVIEDLIRDGLTTDVIVSTNSYFLDQNCNTGIYVFELDFYYDPNNVEWGMFQHDNWHTGAYTLTPTLPIIRGPYTFRVGIPIEYTFNAVDPDGDYVKYIIDWGDNTTDTTTLNPSGTDVKVEHTWSNKGTYVIKVYAQDWYGSNGPIKSYEVNAPRTRLVNIQFLKSLQQHLNLLPFLQKLFNTLGK